MSKKFKSQASSARAASGLSGFGTFQTTASPLSYIAEQPDLSQITESNVVVALKNLSKKDSTTKAKALDELLEKLKDNADLAVLTAWSDLYPRTSIDSSQIVRRNAHTLQGVLTVNAGKTISPFLPKIIPSWLAGTFDSDKSVAKAASDALDKAFATPEKKLSLWKFYKDSIYARVEDALLVQTATTLSDERSTSPDEAESKYVRVVGTGLRLLGQLLSTSLSNTDILQEKKLWDLVNHEDAYLRNATCALLTTILPQHHADLDWKILSTNFIYKALNRNQTGSSKAFVRALCELTEVRPSVWTTDYTAKTAASKRLHQYLRQGSQNGPQDVWSLITELLKKVPIETWKKTDDDAHSLAEAYRTGVLTERVHIDAAWSGYIQLCSWLLDQIANQEIRDIFIEQNLSPIIPSYVNKSKDGQWRVGGRAEKTAQEALRAIARHSDPAVQKAIQSAVATTIDVLKLSLPESSKEFRSSQDAVAAQGKRLISLQTDFGTTTQASNSTLLKATLDLLKSRNGKPYGSAMILQELAKADTSTKEPLSQFLESDLDSLLDSPSCEYLVYLAISLNKQIGLSLLKLTPQSPNIVRGIETFAQSAPKEQFEDGQVQGELLVRVGGFENETNRALAISLLANSNLQGHILKTQMWSRLVSGLSAGGNQSNALAMLEILSTQTPLSRDLMQSNYGPDIASKLLILADAPDQALAERATSLTKTLVSAEGSAIQSIPIIRQQLQGQGELLSVLTLADLGLAAMSRIELHELLPDEVDWLRALSPHYRSNTHPSLSITSPLHGVVWLTEPIFAADHPVVRDAEEFSLLFRITFFVTKILESNPQLNKATGPRLKSLQRWYPLALELINEKLTLDEANDVWLGSTAEVIHAASDILKEGIELLRRWQEIEDYVQSWLLRGSELEGLGRDNYLLSIAFQRHVSMLFDTQSHEVLQAYSENLNTIHKSDDILESSALLSALNDYLVSTNNGLKMINELLSEVMQSPQDFVQMALLNLLVRGQPSILEKVPQPRVMLVFKAVVNYLGDAPDGKSLSESFTLISFLIPLIQDIYSDLWAELLSELIEAWDAADVPLIYATLQVYTQLKHALRMEKVNDDLSQAWSTQKSSIDQGLLHCLQSLSTSSTEVDQPRSITAEILRRKLVDVTIPEDFDIFHLLSSGQSAVRGASFDLLHRTIPAKQERLSIELALDQKIAQLPDELNHLISDPGDIQRYLLSWKLIFDHFPTSSYRLREAYIANLKDTGYVDRFLEILCDRVRITSGRPIDASKYKIVDYEIDVGESHDHDIQWLSIHLYYLALLYLPSLVKDWFLQQKNRVKQPLEAWTQKHMSFFIIASSLLTVTQWSTSQDQDDRPVDVKTSARAAEIVASITVDPESPPISLSISLPPTFPLESPVVSSRTRVGVSEKNWTSWLRTFQIIIFSSGSIIEGLVAFRRNVQGALKGQSECAICYSIIGTDMQTPSKKCSTCKNMFHGVCLFRWFKSSNSSSCPLCRNNFNYA